MVYSERVVMEYPRAKSAISSAVAAPGELFLKRVRGDWGIENWLHWVLDVGFGEDDSRLRKDHGPENLALVRRMAASGS